MTPHASYPYSDQPSPGSATECSDKAEYPSNSECALDDTVAIVGMGCRWPGGVTTPSQLWDLLANGKSGYSDFDDDSKLNIPGFYHPNPQRPGSTPARGAYQLREDPKLFDHAFFGITPTETLTLDPQHRKLLEVVYEAFEDAGEPWEKFSGSRTGVFVGNFTADHNLMQSRDIDNLLPYSTTGGSTSILSNRINYIFNLHGPSLTLDTACSSSLYALHLAVNAIKNGDCDSAIVGAGNLILSPDLHLSLSKLGALSPTTTCHVFDAAADGYARGEGFAAFYLKKTSDAVAGSYPIRSVVRGTAINSNGRTAGITHPSAEGQVEVIRQAYANANLDPSMTGYFEAHGTGTQVGDPTEINAIGQVFSQSSGTSDLRIGSVKSNIGHTEAASGMAGLMKAVLSMENELIPPTIGIRRLNPRIDFKGARVRPVTRLEPWPVDRLRRVSINSFGYGGANGHCVLDDVSVALPGGTRRMVILPFSAKEETALKENMQAISNVMYDSDLADLIYTLSARRSRFKHRDYCVVDAQRSSANLDIKTTTPSKPVAGQKPNIGLVFTGQGAQWEGMGAELFEYAVFRNSIAHQDSTLASLSNAPSWSIYDIISGKLRDRLHEPMISQAVCTALQVALIDLLRSWKMEWIGAAYAAGLVTAAEAITIAYCRGLAVASNKKSGLMLAVGLGRDEIEPIAAVNSPASVTLSGDTAPAMELFEILLSKGVFAKLLQTGRNAYHSHHMASVGDTYLNVIDSTSSSARRQECEWFSSATPDKPRDGLKLDPMYWRWNLQAPVQFSRAVENMMASTTAKSPLRQILFHLGKEFSYLPTLRRHEDGMHAPIDLRIANSTDKVDEKGNLLGYEHGSIYGPIIYHENRLSKENRLRKHLKHDILGSKQLGGSRLRPSWRNVLRIKDIPWLSHHRLAPQAVFPASAYICMAIEAAAQFFHDEDIINSAAGFTIRNLLLNSALVIPENDAGVEVILDLDASKTMQSKDKMTWCTFKISSIVVGTDTWTEHCSGIIKPNTKRDTPALMSDAMDRRTISASKWYKRFRDVGLDYGESFRRLTELSSDPLLNVAQAKVALQTTSELFNGPESAYLIHPAALDMCAQLALIAAHGGQVEQMSTAYVPSFVGELTIWAPTTHGHDFGTATAKGACRGLRGAYAKAQLVNTSGELMLDIIDIRCTAYSGVSQEQRSVEKASGSPYMRLVWKPYLEKMSWEQARTLFPPTETTGGMENMFADVDKLGALMVIDIAENFGDHASDLDLTDHFQKFLAWAGRMANSASSMAIEAAATSSADRISLINELCIKLQDVVEVPISKRIYDNLDNILTGTKSSLEVIRQDDSHSKMYNSGLGISAAYTQLERIVDLLAHANPGMNILEIGAGTGGATRVALRTLDGENYLRRYHTYTFTDVSHGYFLEARKEFSQYHGLDFGVLDIEQAPSSQGFEPIYDLVIASCSIHVTKDINLTLSNARSLLQPGGKLLILECTQPKITHGLVLGTLPDYWIGTEEARKDSPFLPVEAWQTMLCEAGFSGIDIELDDYPQPYTMISTFLTSAVEVGTLPVALDQALSELDSTPVQIVSFFGLNPASYIDNLKANHLTGPTYAWLDSSENLPEQSRVIVLSNGSSPLPNSNSQFSAIKRVLSKSQSVLWINIADDSIDSYPYVGVVNGLLRVMAAENPSIVYTSVSVSTGDLENDSSMEQILELHGTLLTKGESSLNAEYQIVDGTLSISRLIADNDLNERSLHVQTTDAQLLPIGDQPPLAASFATPGILSSVFFEEDTAFWKPLSDNQIEVRTVAVGLNWKDLAVCAGRLDLDNFSSECSGIVTNVGKEVTTFQVGEKVFGISKGKFGNYMRCHSSLVQHMHAENFTEMAAVPVVYMTALYSLINLGRVEAGEKILIQSASGGVGIAAINLARRLGADIWVTVGNQEKRAFLRDTTSPSIEAVKEATGGAGFDLILSMGSGDAGRFVDVGRVDVQNHATMALEVFKRNATFSSFDLGILIEDKPALCGKLLAEVTEMLHNGSLPPVSPIKTFGISQLAPALLYLSKGTHVGKVVITYDDHSSLINMVPPKSGVRFDSTAKYVLVGGLGGLGRSIISWMTERGARNFVTLSRSAPDQADSPFISSIAAQGYSLEHICCDVSHLSEVEAVIAQTSQSGVIKGIVHTAVSLQDKLFDSLTFSQWQRGLAVKVDGTINLHKASLHLPLDFFVLVSSNVAQVALPTQATYCASNNFQNEFARYRRSIGLPAMAVEFGLIEEAGDLGQNPVYHNATMRNGLYHTSEYAFLEHLDHVFANIGIDNQMSDWRRYDNRADGHLITALDPARLLELEKAQQGTASSELFSKARWHSDVRFSHIIRAMENLAALDEGATAKPHTPLNSSSDAQAALSEVDAIVGSKDIGEATLLVTKSIIARMADMLFISAEGIDATKGVAAYGMDSLIAAELRNWFVSTYKCTISFLKLLDTATSITELADIVIASRVEVVGKG
ncbi:polyketide synthase [Cucurbitaria berberidis CBS 394.84]|uniref:Polyketide synthase n=1 Tax=Cucurbitaria berberidis CBS 394.84 TaxID=1168544 RepID=A0A9P4GC70_9PLEO|nr:polyketide synthase [Cucurbitaria berberidis CBS 394.84]KAF1843183.1 polyketide synthase [Cucurbitaria berberidis CBS 394.84]